jgi:hypothetical protein
MLCVEGKCEEEGSRRCYVKALYTHTQHVVYVVHVFYV